MLNLLVFKKAFDNSSATITVSLVTLPLASVVGIIPTEIFSDCAFTAIVVVNKVMIVKNSFFIILKFRN